MYLVKLILMNSEKQEFLGPVGKLGIPGLKGVGGIAGNEGERGVCPTYCAIDGGIFFEDGKKMMRM